MFIRVLPKIGILSDLAIKIPTPTTQSLYVESMNGTIETYAGLLKQLAHGEQLTVSIVNRNLDTGEKGQLGAYEMADKTYAQLLHKIATGQQRSVALELKQDILGYYDNPNAPISTKDHKRASAQVVKDLDVLRNM